MRDQFDRQTVDRELATYAPEQVGRTQSLTPKGFLLCSGVRIARTGPMLYRHDEVPEVAPGPDGAMTVIVRGAETLFAPDTLASFAGMDVTNDHPDELITPNSPRRLSVGTVMDPRRGEGIDSEYLVADLLIKDAKAIDDIQAKRKREVSCGYDAEVEEIKPGLGRQTRIVGNHVAIVDRGRAGPACAIQDQEPDMAKKTTIQRALDRVRKAFKDGDESELNKGLETLTDEDGDEEGDDKHRIVLEIAQPAAPVVDRARKDADGDEDEDEKRLKAVEDGIANLGAKMDAIAKRLDEDTETDEEKAAREKREGETADEGPEEKEAVKPEEVMDAIAKSEKILPGFRPSGTMDSAKGATLTSMRRDVLTRAFADSARKPNVEAVAGANPDFSKMGARQVRALFDGIAAVAHLNNNRGGIRTADIPQGRMTAAKMQELNVERRKQRA